MSIKDMIPATDEDFIKLREVIYDNIDWNLVYEKENKFVWTKLNKVSAYQMMKVKAFYPDLSANCLYDTLHDPLYRKEWDFTMIEGKEIYRINETNDIGYYAMEFPKPLSNRDFVTLRSWKDLGKEKYIMNHSITHPSIPVSKNFVRAVSHLTGYIIVSEHDDASLEGCTLNYITQSDPKGNMPVWLVNRATQWLAPKVIEKLYAASKGYEKWKLVHDPGNKPWKYPYITVKGMKEEEDTDTLDIFRSCVMQSDSQNMDQSSSNKPKK